MKIQKISYILLLVAFACNTINSKASECRAKPTLCEDWAHTCAHQDCLGTVCTSEHTGVEYICDSGWRQRHSAACPSSEGHPIEIN